MKLEVKHTNDNSVTFYNPALDEHYHSVHGAYQESMHVYIKMGVEHVMPRNHLRIMEMGFGTGLNVLISQQFAEQHQVQIDFTTVEKFPLKEEHTNLLNYAQSSAAQEVLKQLHACDWETENTISPHFNFTKHHTDLFDFTTNDAFDVVYYDAFGPRVQPELWEQPVFDKLFSLLHKGGVLVTYCAKGQVRRNMLAAGFEVERVEGPPGKREMLRATKPVHA
jgi:tRNA U34 5-methylaminomethyl-2-thiouridine-forming methyltransferase MnmC